MKLSYSHIFHKSDLEIVVLLFPDHVALLPDKHQVINICSSCSDHWTFGSCHHSVCVIFFSRDGSTSIQQQGSDFKRRQPCSSSTAEMLMYHSTGASTTPHAAFFNFMISPGDTFRAAVSSGTGNTPRSLASLQECSTDVSLGGRETHPCCKLQKQLSGVIRHSWRCCWSLFRVGIQISQNHNASLGRLVRVFIKSVFQNPSHLQYAFSRWFLMRLQFFQHIVHLKVLGILLFGWVELFSLFR